MKIVVVILIAGLFCVLSCSKPEPAIHSYPISSIDIKDVVLTDKFWLPRIDLIQKTTIKHAFEKCLEEGRMHNFLVAGKVKEGKTMGQMPFDDTDLYKTIEGASYSLISMPDKELDMYLDTLIAVIKIGQEPDGYLTTWFTIDREHPPANWVKPSKERWENEISSHELYNSGHLFEAAAAHYHATSKRNLLEIALKNADLLVKNFKPEGVHVPPGHQIVETGLVKLYDITKNEDYLKLARYFIDLRGDSTTHKLYGAYNQDHVPVTEQSEAVGHAVRAEYMYAGMADIAAIYQDQSYSNSLDNLWDNVVNKKTYLTGGLGSRHNGEAFGDNYELPNLSGYGETCAAIGSVWWNQKMFQLRGDAKYYDVLERTLYNGLISGISADGKLFFYTNPLESDGEFKFNRGFCTRQSWFDCSCCPTNLIRFIPYVPALIYAAQKDTVYTNLFISSNVRVGNISIKQQSGYPWSGHTTFHIEPDTKSTFTMKIRIPGWLRNEAVPGDLYTYLGSEQGTPTLTINSKSETPQITNGYLTITREWQKGDVIDLELPMNVRRVKANRLVTDNTGKTAFEVGPIVYCAEQADNPNMADITSNIDLKIEKRNLLGESVNALTGQSKSGPITLIPYYQWSNRGVGKMKVWIPD